MDVKPDLQDVAQAIERSRDYFFQAQRPSEGWRDYTASSAFGTAMSVLVLHYEDAERYAAFIQRGCEWLRETQYADGGWGDAVVDASNLNATGFALPALKIADPDRSVDAIAHGMEFIEAHGGRKALSDPRSSSLFVCCLTFMTLAGLGDFTWDHVPNLLVILICLPQSWWQVVSFAIPAVFALGLMHSRKKSLPTPLRWLVKATQERGLRWLRQAQGENGGYQESPLLVAVVYLGLHHAGIGQDIAARCLDFILETRRSDGSWTCQRYLDVSVTTYILEALETVGSLHDQRLQPVIPWLFSQQFTSKFFQTGAPAGAWSWGRPSGWADMDDTAGVLIMLQRMGVSSQDPRIQLGYQCLHEMQNKDGSWGMFVKHNRHLKLDTYSRSIDQPCPGLTARIIIALYQHTQQRTKELERALQYLRGIQRPDGAIFALWFHDYVYGTAFTLEAFVTVGLLEDNCAQLCRKWLLSNQNDDGSWGGSYGTSGTVEETAWALAALSMPGVATPQICLHQGIRWLLEHQRTDGTWPQAVVGVYFPEMWYSDDHIANGFALRALGRYWQQVTGEDFHLANNMKLEAKSTQL